MGSLLNAINRTTMLNWFTEMWADAMGEISDLISNIIGSILWLFSDIFFVLLNLFESLYRKFAGIDPNVTSGSGEAIEGDLVLYFIQSNIVQQIFMSILILSLFLLIIFTIFAIVKNQYADKQEPVSKIINSSFKALLMYLLVPVATVVCLLVGNVVLQAIDGATRTNDYAQTTADALFGAATYNANRLRSGSTEDKAKQLHNMVDDGYLPSHIMDLIEQECNVDLGDENTYYSSAVDYDKMAVIIDEAFITGNLLNGANNDSSKYDWTHVNNFYYALKISYIIIWIGGAFLIISIGKITWGLVARLFKMVLFYAISPALMATFPIDGGKALGSWRGEMVKNGTMAFCGVGVLNVLYSILPFFNDIKLFSSGFMSGIANGIVKLFIYIIAFSSAKDLINTISGWFGVGNALAEGEKAKGQVKGAYDNAKKKLTNATKKGLGYFAGIKGGIEEAEAHGGKKLSGAIQGLFSQTGTAKTFSDYGKTFQDAQKAGAAQYKDIRTMHISDEKKKAKLAEYEAYDTRKKLKGQYEAMTGGDGVYSVSADDGTDPTQLKFREFLKNASDAGQAVYEDDLQQQKVYEAKNKQMSEFVGEINKVAKANKKQIKSEGKLKTEFDAIFGSGSWDSFGGDMNGIQDIIGTAIRDGYMGKNLDVLKDLNTAYSEATKDVEDATRDFDKKKSMDDKFNDFVTNKAFGIGLVSKATSADLTDLNQVQKSVDAYEKSAIKLAEKAEELQKQIAKKNEEDIYGRITDPTEISKIENYRKAHPKS